MQEFDFLLFKYTIFFFYHVVLWKNKIERLYFIALGISVLWFCVQTEKGSALHEAALFGKTDVVQKLLRAGQSWPPG